MELLTPELIILHLHTSVLDLAKKKPDQSRNIQMAN